MDPKEALRHIRALIKVAATTDDVSLIHRHLKEMLTVVDKGIKGSNVVSLRPGK